MSDTAAILTLVYGFAAGVVLGFFIAGWRIRTRALDRYHTDVDRYEAAVTRYLIARYGDDLAAFQHELDALEGWPR